MKPPERDRPPGTGLPAAALLALATVPALQGLQLLSLGPWSVHWPRAAAWPQGFHAWLLETTAWLVAGSAVLAQGLRPRWRAWPGQRRAGALALALVAAQALLAAAFWWTREHGVGQLGGLRAAFHLGGEFRIPALFASGQALLAAALAWSVHRQERHRAWGVVAAACLYIGTDELLSVHERVGDAVRGLGGLETTPARTLALAGGLHVYAWQVVFLPLAAGLGLWLLAQFRALVDRGTLGLLCLAALLFIGGSVGMEAVQATSVATVAGWRGSDAMHLNLLVEESLETLGMTVAVFVLAGRAWRAPSPLSSPLRARRESACRPARHRRSGN